MVWLWGEVAPSSSAAVKRMKRMDRLSVAASGHLSCHRDSHVTVTKNFRRLDSLYRRPGGPAQELRLDPYRPQVVAADILQRHGHHFGRPVDRHVPIELQAEAWREVVAL